MARNVADEKAGLKMMYEPTSTNEYVPELGVYPPRAAAQGTTWLGRWTWDSGPNCIVDGWTSVDLTAQTHDFWHVDDLAGLGGGLSGLLVPLEGNQSMWCGARPNAADPNLCGYGTLPGYGNGWNQALCSASCITGTDIAICLSAMWDSEGNYDATTLEIDECDDNWVELYGGFGVWDGLGTDTLCIAVSDTLHSGSLRFRFHFIADGAWSDSDGLWNTDGAFMMDEVTVFGDYSTTPVALVDYENFEDETVGDNDANDWVTCTPEGYGDFTGLFPGLGIVQEDDCYQNLTCMWVFFNGSTYDYTCGGWPGQLAVPYENARGQYLDNQINSPWMEVIGSGSVWELNFDTYRDLPLGPLIFYDFSVRSLVAGCPGAWRSDNYIYYGPDKDWITLPQNRRGIGQLIEQGATHVQISLGATDMCLYWAGIYGNCQCHTQSPMFDDASFYRIAAEGPSYNVKVIDLFQDNFSGDGTITGTARADMANDILPGDNPNILPGDSVVITCAEPEVGVGFHVDGDTSSGCAVYTYVRVDGAHGGVVDGNLLDDPRYTLTGTVSAAGETWAVIQMDSANNQAAIVADQYCIDLNDNYFVPGDTIWYFFGAKSNTNAWTWWSYRIPGPNTVYSIDEAAYYPDEFTILPAGGYERGGDILYVDGMDDRDGQIWYDTAFDYLGIRELVDRYDICGPSSGVANHPGGRVVDPFQQIIPIYKKIFYNTGNLDTAFGDGTGSPDKSDDTGLLFNFLNNLGQEGGVWLNGDDVSDEWKNTLAGASAIQLNTNFMNFDVESGDHKDFVNISPYVVGEASGFFKDTFGNVDTMIAYGGCPVINNFDVLVQQGASVLQMQYHQSIPGPNGGPKPATLSQVTTNSQTVDVGFVLEGFGYQYIRDAFPPAASPGYPTRVEHMWRILLWLGNLVDEATDAHPTDVTFNELRQNRPNPFNPTTTIDFQVKHTGHVTLKIYNVAGQLVRTLVDEQVSAGKIHTAQWKGVNDAGQSVSSGVYFYKLVTNDFTMTKKMVLLK
jgi:hypothetical protein